MKPRVRHSLAATALVVAALLMNGCGGCTGNNWRQSASGPLEPASLYATETPRQNAGSR